MSSAHLGLERAEGEEWRREVGGELRGGGIRSDFVGLLETRGAEGTVDVVEVL